MKKRAHEIRVGDVLTLLCMDAAGVSVSEARVESVGYGPNRIVAFTTRLTDGRALNLEVHGDKFMTVAEPPEAP